METSAFQTALSGDLDAIAALAAALMGGLEGRQIDQQQRDLTASGNADFAKYISGFGMGNTASASPSPSAYAAAIDPGSSSLQLTT